MPSAKLSPPLSSDHLRNYHRSEYTSAASAYFTEDGKVMGQWHGDLIQEFGLTGTIDEWDFLMLGHGADPRTGEQLVEHRRAQEVKDPDWVSDDAKWRDKVEEMFAEAVLRHGEAIAVASPATADIVRESKREGGLEFPSWSDPLPNPRAGESRSEPEIVSLQSLYEMQMAVALKAAPEIRYSVATELAERLGVDPPEARAELKKKLEHRGGWDLVLSPPKSVSVTGLIGEDDRIRIAHRESVLATLDYGARYVQARIGGNHPAETTGKALWATFEHDSSRPEKGYAAPQLHTHCILFNMTKRADGTASALEPREMFRIQNMLSEVYRAELMFRLRRLGYELERTANIGIDGQPHASFEITGYTREYLEAESPRRQRIVAKMQELGLTSARANDIAAHADREDKLTLTREELLIVQRAHAADHGADPRAVVASALRRGRQAAEESSAAHAVTFSRNHLGERESILEHYALVENALRYGFGHYRVADVEQEISRRINAGDLLKASHIRPHAPGARYRTPRAMASERYLIQSAVNGAGRVHPVVDKADLSRYDGLTENEPRRRVLEGILETRDQTVLLSGAAGAGKCLAAGTLVLLYCGALKPVEEVKVGDLLVGPDSQPRRVLSLAHGFDEMYTVVPVKGDPYTVNSEHILSLQMTGMMRRFSPSGNKGWRWRAGTQVNISMKAYLARGRGFKIHAKGWRAGVEFSPKVDPTLDPYFIGLWLGDGDSNNQGITNPDVEIAEFLSGYANALGLGLTNTVNSSNCPRLRISLGNRKGVKNKLGDNPALCGLRALNLLNNKHIPDVYKTNTRDVRLRVLAGILDTDGHLSKGGYDYISVSERLARDVAFMARSLGLAAYLKPCRKACQTGAVGDYFRVSISGDVSVIPVQVERKKAKPREQKKSVTRTGIKVVSAGYGEYFGFELDGDGLFLLGDFTVTHNSTSLKIVAEVAKDNGWAVQGLGPTGKAAVNLQGSGVSPTTLQRFLMLQRGPAGANAEHKNRFFFLDEGTLVSRRQMREFFEQVRPTDRVLIVGDDPEGRVSQHHSVEAGRVFRELQVAGVKTAQLNKILRQQDTPWLLDVVRATRSRRLDIAVKILDEQGKIEEYLTNPVRYRAIAGDYASEYALDPKSSVVITADNRSRLEIGEVVRQVMKQRELLGEERMIPVFIQRDPGSRENLKLASSYKLYDTVRYLYPNKTHGVQTKDYGTVIDIDRTRNILSVGLNNGQVIQYDPRTERLNNVSLYDTRELGIAVGDRIQITAPYKQKGLSTRETGTVHAWEGKEILVDMDDGRRVRWNINQFRHFDHAYVMTSQSAQSMTVNRSFVNVDTSDHQLKSLLDERFAYVAWSRARHDMIVYTNSREDLVQRLRRSPERHMALSVEEIKTAARTKEPMAEKAAERMHTA